MATLSEVRNDILDDTLRDDLTSAQLNKAINRAIKFWEGERFMFNEGRFAFETLDGQEYYGLTTPEGNMVLEIDSITCTVNNYPYPLVGRTQQWFDTHQALPSQYKGQPESYAIYGNLIRLFPVPDNAGPNDGAYEIVISSLARLAPVPLVNDNDTNAWLTEGEDLIREQAKVYIYRDLLRDADGAALAKDALTEAQWSLKRKMAGKAFTGSIKAWTL